MDRVIEVIPPPRVERDKDFKALIFDSWFDKYRGALNLIYLINGQLKTGEEIQSVATKKFYPIKSISILRPEETTIETM